MSDVVIQFGVVGTFGDIDGWSMQGSTGNAAQQERNLAITLDKDGNESAATTYGDDVLASSEYEAGSGATASAPANIGQYLNGFILTSLSVNTSATAKATMSLSGHNHLTNSHADGGCRTASHNLAQGINAFGATDFLGGTAGSNADVFSGSVTIQVEHQDEPNNVGNHLSGENYHCTAEAETVWNGQPSAFVGSGWTLLSAIPSEENTGHIKWTVRGRRSFTLA